MTDTLFINARLIDPVAQTDLMGALLVSDGVISQVFEDPQPVVKGAVVVNCAGHCLAPGIVDIGVKVSEPGERHKESFRSAGRAAAAGKCLVVGRCCSGYVKGAGPASFSAISHRSWSPCPRANARCFRCDGHKSANPE